MTANPKTIIKLSQIVKSYQNGDEELQILKGID